MVGDGWSSVQWILKSIPVDTQHTTSHHIPYKYIGHILPLWHTVGSSVFIIFHLVSFQAFSLLQLSCLQC